MEKEAKKELKEWLSTLEPALTEESAGEVSVYM